jgi:transposase
MLLIVADEQPSACRRGAGQVHRDNGTVTVCSPVRVVLSSGERQVLVCRARRARGEQRDVLQARIVLAAAQGLSNAAIAARLAVAVDTVRKWRGRFAVQRLAGLEDRPRSGRPRTFPAVAAVEVKAMACALPAETGVPLARWSCAELATEAVNRAVVESVSPSTVRRWLAEDAIKPWQYRSWIFPRDPDFAVKAGRVLDLYDRLWEGQPLGEDEYVISADEKSQLQALRRRHGDLPPAPGRVRRQEFEYRRGGTLAYLAATTCIAAR